MQRLTALLADNTDDLAERIRGCAVRSGYGGLTPASRGIWHKVTEGLVAGLDALQQSHGAAVPEPVPGAPDAPQPPLGPMRDTARLHRQQGVSLHDYLGLLKHTRQVFLDFAAEHVRPPLTPEGAESFLQRGFDQFELAAAQVWTSGSSGQLVAELQRSNRELQRERDRFLTALESISDPLFLISDEGTVRHMNLAATTFLRLSSHQSARGVHLGKLLPWLNLDVRNFLADESEVRHIQTAAWCFGEERHFTVSLAKMLETWGTFSGAVVLVGDVTEQKNTECALQASERELTENRDLMQLIVDGMPALISYVDADYRYRFANAYYAQIFHLSPDSLLGRTVRDLIGEDTWSAVEPRYRAAMGGRAQHFRLPYTPPTGGRRHFDVNYIPHLTGGEVQGVIVLIIDETERRQAEQERQRFFDVSLDLMCVAGMDGFFKKINAAWSRVLGWEREELLATPWLDFVHPDDHDRTIEAGETLRRGEMILNFENRFRCQDGSYKWLSWNSLPLPDEDLVYAVAHDTTKRRDMEEELMRLATRDSLTGTNNRRQFMELAEAEMRRAKRYGRPASLLMLDIDHFKRINDTLGHPAGDEVLRELVRACADALRKSDILGRLGGEEFAAMLPETDAENALRTAERIRTDIEDLAVEYGANRIHFTISLGVATADDDGPPLDELLKCADDALYEAKRSGRNRVVTAQSP